MESILREQRPVESLVPALVECMSLSEKQIKFLLHAIHDVNPETVDAEKEVRRRVLDIQRKAYEIYPYPCIRTFRFVSLLMSENRAFAHVVEAGSKSIVERAHARLPVFLDVGCCSKSFLSLNTPRHCFVAVGTDLRYLVHSGYPHMAVIGCDIRRDFIDLGYALYGDRDTCPIPFFVGDVLDVVPRSESDAGADTADLDLRDVRHLDALRGRVKYLYAGALFHLFDEKTQEAIAGRLVTLLDRPTTDLDGPTVLFGRQSAKRLGEEGIIADAMGRYVVMVALWMGADINRTRYAHSSASWRRMWEKVLDAPGIRVRVDADVRLDKEWWNSSQSTGMMWWSVWVSA